MKGAGLCVNLCLQSTAGQLGTSVQTTCHIHMLQGTAHSAERCLVIPQSAALSHEESKPKFKVAL